MSVRTERARCPLCRRRPHGLVPRRGTRRLVCAGDRPPPAKPLCRQRPHGRRRLHGTRRWPHSAPGTGRRRPSRAAHLLCGRSRRDHRKHHPPATAARRQSSASGAGRRPCRSRPGSGAGPVAPEPRRPRKGAPSDGIPPGVRKGAANASEKCARLRIEIARLRIEIARFRIEIARAPSFRAESKAGGIETRPAPRPRSRESRSKSGEREKGGGGGLPPLFDFV